MPQILHNAAGFSVGEVGFPEPLPDGFIAPEWELQDRGFGDDELGAAGSADVGGEGEFGEEV